MSNKLFNMLRRVLIRAVLLALLLLGVTVAAIQIEQRLLRTRAEHLLEDIRSLELRRSTWADAQRIFTRWGAWGHYDGACVSSSCNYEVAFADTLWNRQRLIPDAIWARRAWGDLGGRRSLVMARVLVADGLVVGKGFAVFVEVPPESGPNAPFSGYGYALIGRAETHAFSLGGSLRQHLTHPEYSVTSPSACTGCMAVWVRFTPLADPTDVRRLMDFNLACLTNYKPCREQEDIMPSAWKQHLAEMQGEKAAVDAPTP